VKAAAGLALAMCLCGIAGADTLLPTAPGTTWKYQMTQEFGEGVHPSADENAKVDSDAKVHVPISMFISGTEKIDGVETIKYEMHRQGHVQLIEFLKVDENAVVAMARSDSEGEMYKLVPPQKILGLAPHEGDKWNYNVSSIPAEKKPLHAALAKALTVEPTTSFAPDLPKIYARWQGEALQKGDKIRCVWFHDRRGRAGFRHLYLIETEQRLAGRQISRRVL
jgi:hypothetical protein